MIPLIVLLGVFAVASIVIRLRNKKANWQLAGRIAMSAMLLFTAAAHFVFTDGMTKMIPEPFPLKRELVYMTGVLELVLAVGLLAPKAKTTAGWALMLFFVAVLPANINASIENINYQTGELDGNGIEYLWFRVPLQIFFIVWVFFSSIKRYRPSSSDNLR